MFRNTNHCVRSPFCPCGRCQLEFHSYNASRRAESRMQKMEAEKINPREQAEAEARISSHKKNDNVATQQSDNTSTKRAAPLAPLDERDYPNCTTNELLFFNKIYAALCAGETSLFKQDANARAHVAWSLVQKYFNQVNPDDKLIENAELFRDIYQHAYNMSGIFKRSLSFGQSFFATKAVTTKLTALESDAIHEHIQSAKDGSRTAKIKKCLG